MTFLPIVARELRVTARKSRTYWSRTGVAAVMLGVASWVFLISLRQAPAAQAVAIFGTLAGALLVVGGFSGMGATADALSSEKREGTLGLLFLTPLRGYDVVLGKLVAGSLSVLYGLLSVTPLLALPLLMGGLTAGQFGRMALLLLNTMLLSLAVGICISSISRDEKRARSGTLLVMVLLAGGLPLAGALLEFELKMRGVLQWALLSSPGYAFAAAWDRSRGTSLADFWHCMLALHLMTWLFLALACYLTPRTWQDRSAGGKGWVMRLLNRRAMDGRATAAFRSRMLDQNAFGWLAARPQYKAWLVWVVLGCVTLTWLGFGVKYPGDMFNPIMFIVMALTWNAIVKVWVASESTRQIALDRRSGSIELLLSTPLTVRDIAYGLRLSLTRQFGGPVVAILLAECLLALLGAGEVGHGEDRLTWLAVWLCGMMMLLADLAALYAVGLWQSAVAKAPAQAAGAAAFRILALPWILYMLLLAAMAVVDGLNLVRGLPNPSWVFWLLSWVCIGCGVNLVFGVKAWHDIHTRFRQVAAQPSMDGGWGGRLGRLFARMTAQRNTVR